MSSHAEAAGVLVKVGVVMVDGSFLDVYWSSTGRYSLHYERRHIDGRVYRHDNAPHPRHRSVSTSPSTTMKEAKITWWRAAYPMSR